jgi:hypothetical protein
MGCEIYVFRKDVQSTTPDHGEVFWDTKSWELGYELTRQGFGDHYKTVTAEFLTELCLEVINNAEYDDCDYSNENIMLLLDQIIQLDPEIVVNSTWFLTLCW